MGVAAAVAVLRHAVKRRRISLRECGNMGATLARVVPSLCAAAGGTGTAVRPGSSQIFDTRGAL